VSRIRLAHAGLLRRGGDTSRARGRREVLFRFDDELWRILATPFIVAFVQLLLQGGVGSID
jgi:hypothetical protein